MGIAIAPGISLDSVTPCVEMRPVRLCCESPELLIMRDMPWMYPVVVVDVGGRGGGEGAFLVNRLSSFGVGFGFLGRKLLDSS